jgi:RND family efflux transporter MFP subunit
MSGWVEKLFVSYTGQPVREGEPILSIFSPELVASQEEYVQSRRAADLVGTASSDDVRAASEAIAAAGRRRLELLDVPRRTIERLDRGEAPKRSVTLVAPVSGFVTAKPIFAGQQVDPGTELFTVTDLRKVWIEAAVYEDDAPLVRVGQRAVFTFPYDPTRRLEATISYIFPYLDTATRTQKVRFDVDNADLSLKPGMFVDVNLEVRTERGVVIPDSAILDTGTQAIVYVEIGPGRFVPRAVEIGGRSDGRALVLTGLAAGERVVIKGNFLLDSESRIRAAAIPPAAAPAPPAGAAP